MAKHADRVSDPSGATARSDWYQPSSRGIFGRPRPVSNGSQDIHRVAVRNINAFGGTVECTAKLDGHTRRVKFVPLAPYSPGSVSDTTWTAQASLPPRGERTLDHVGFTPTGASHGDQGVEVEVKVTWASRFNGPPVTLRLSFDVSA